MNHVEDYLKFYKVEELKQLAKNIGVKGFSKLKKEELIEAIKRTQQLPETAAHVYQYIDSQSFHSLKETAKLNDETPVQEFVLEDVFGLYIMGYAFEFEDKEDVFFISEEIQKLYDVVDTEENYEMRLEVQRWLNLVRASLHLYGVVGFDQITHLFKTYYHEDVEIEELISFLEESPYDITIHKETREFVIDDMTEDQYMMVRKLQGDRPYYEPEFAKFIKFSNPNYIDESTYHINLRKFIETYIPTSSQGKHPVYIELLKRIMSGESRAHISEYLASYGINFTQKAEENEFFDNIAGIVKNTRHFKYRGFRETELHVKTVVKEEKVGRNDPCPCGSGRKYKKCCGK